MTMSMSMSKLRPGCQTALLELCPESLRAQRTPTAAQLDLDLRRRPEGRGGWRPGAGRPRGRTKVAHLARPAFAARHPLHVTLRLRPEVASLRRRRALAAVKGAIASAQRADTFRIVQFCVLSNHLHLLCESTDARALASGMQGFAVRAARAINRAQARVGTVFAERYHARALRSPREVRNVLVYLLHNARKHLLERGQRPSLRSFDPCSSAAWFDGWSRPLPRHERWMRQVLAEPTPVVPARTWLASIGWRRWGPLRLDAMPGAQASTPRD
jgi:REP element-mobilizing transposase RayT